MARKNHKCFLCDTMIRRSEFLCVPCNAIIDAEVQEELQRDSDVDDDYVQIVKPCMFCDTETWRNDGLCVPCATGLLKQNLAEMKKQTVPHDPIESNPADWPRNTLEDVF